MNIAIICNKKHMYKNIQQESLKIIGIIHYYRTVNEFKNSEMINYSQLILYNYILNTMNSRSIYDLKGYCENNNIEVFIYHVESEEKAKIDFNVLLNSHDSISDDTVELKAVNPSSEDHSSKIEIIKTVYKNIPQINIGIFNLSEKAGSTFIAINLAKELSKSNVTVTYIEIPLKRPYAFDYLGLPNKLGEYDKDYREYFYVGDLIGDKDLETQKKRILQEENISWIVMNPLEKQVSIEECKIPELINLCKFSSINIIDIGKIDIFNNINPLLYKMDYLVLIIDPLPSEILQNEELLIHFKKNIVKNNNLIMLINKFDKQVKIKELEEYLDFEPIITVSHIDIGYIYKAIYNYKTPIEIKECSKGLSEDMKKIMKIILPKDVATKESKEMRLIGRLKRCKIEKFCKK